MNEGESHSSPAPEKPSWIAGIIRFCLENKLVVALIVLAVVIAGIIMAPFDWEFERLPRWPVAVDAIPDIGENQQIVFTRWMGRSPQDVEDQISYPLTVALLGIPNVRTIRSYSMFGFSTIFVIFDEKVDFYWSRSRVMEKLASLPAGTLPQGVSPALGPDATALGQIFWYTLEGRDPDGNPIGGWDLHELRSVQDWYVRYDILSAEGISEVGSVGGFVQEYQIDVDPDALRAHGVKLDDVFRAVKMSNVDVGARTIEVNKVEYVVRGLGFIREVSDIENSVVKVNENVPLYIKNVAKVSLGPALRRGALDKEGAEAVGGVVVVRYGFNPLAAIKNVKAKIAKLEPGLPIKAIVRFDAVDRTEVEAFAGEQGFEAFEGASLTLNQEGWLAWLREHAPETWPAWVTTSQLKVVPFYDRTGLIYETLGTLETALSQEILITIIVIIVMVLHLRSSLLISASLPLAVLLCFIAMKLFGVDANIVALSGIAIAIGTIVDMGVIVCENILRHLDQAGPDEDRLEVVYRAASEVGGAVVTAVLTTVVSFLPVFFMTGAEGKLFKPLAFTKTFALIASVIVALTIVPAAAHLLFGRKRSRRPWKAGVVLIIVGLAHLFLVAWWAGVLVLVLGLYHVFSGRLPGVVRAIVSQVANAAAVLVVVVLLTAHWLPLGPEKGFARNFIFIAVLVGGLLAFFHLFIKVYGTLLRWCLAFKLAFLTIPTVLILLGVCYVWLGPGTFFGPINEAPADAFAGRDEIDRLVEEGLLESRDERLLWTNAAIAMNPPEFREKLDALAVQRVEQVSDEWSRTKAFIELGREKWGEPDLIRDKPLSTRIRWTVSRDWDGLGREFMPDLDEGSFLYMPTTSTHASIGEALDVLQKQGMALRAIPEVESVVGKIGRADTPLDPAPISMIETVVNYKSEYISDKGGHRVRYRFDKKRNEFVRDENGELIEDRKGRPFRQWRDEIKTPDDIWEEIVKAARIPGTTGAPKLQPIKARIVMLQSGMRAPMGVKVKGPDLETIEAVGLQIERLLKEVPSVKAEAVIADRIVGKPYLEIEIDREAIARYGIMVRRVQDVIEVGIGGKRITTTVEGRERYPVRARYMRELRDEIESLDRILVPAPDGTQIPLVQLAHIRYARGPQVIKSEDTALIGYVLFDKKSGYAEVDVVEECQRYLKAKRAAGEFVLPAGVNYDFAGNYKNQIRARKTLAIVLPLALFVIFLILYFQFRSVPTTLLVFSGIVVAWAGGFVLIGLYGLPGFLNFDVFGVNMRELFQVHPINMSVAIWVGFLALFGIASDNGVVIATFLDQSFAAHHPASIDGIRETTVEGAMRRIRPCLMTSATTILALIPILASAGRGSDIMVPMAIPSFGGMLVVLVSVFVVPVLYCAVKELRFHFARLVGDEQTPEPRDPASTDD